MSKLEIPTITGTHTDTDKGHSGTRRVGAMLLVESETGDSVVKVVVVVVVSGRLRLLTLVKMKGLAYRKHEIVQRRNLRN